MVLRRLFLSSVRAADTLREREALPMPLPRTPAPSLCNHLSLGWAARGTLSPRQGWDRQRRGCSNASGTLFDLNERLKRSRYCRLTVLSLSRQNP